MIAIALLLVLLFPFCQSFQIRKSSFVNSNVISMVAVGESAPDFELKNAQGKSFKLSTYKGKRPVVVFFYPADNTPGCTTEVSVLTINFNNYTFHNSIPFMCIRCAHLKRKLLISKHMALRFLAFHPVDPRTRRNLSVQTN